MMNYFNGIDYIICHCHDIFFWSRVGQNVVPKQADEAQEAAEKGAG